MAERASIHIASDVDETLFNSVDKHVRILTHHYGQMGLATPTYEQVCQLGGTHGAYRDHPDYMKINEFMRNDENFNSGLTQIEGAQEALDILQGLLAIYLTTRPEKLARVTYQELLDNQFPDREVVARPTTIPLEHTSAWKLDVLTQLAQQNQGTAVMIDDSLSLYKTIATANNENVKGILFDGPITPKGNGELNWGQIVALLMMGNSSQKEDK